MKKNIYLFLLMIFTYQLNAQSQKVVISEFMAINDKTLYDEDGDDSDWIELHNPGDASINVNGWYLTDKADNLTKWEIPNITIQAGGYLIVFASEKKRNDPSGELHTNFKLSGSGEYLAIVEADGTSISHAYNPAFPAQRKDVSYGIYQGQNVYFDSPTPGAENTHGSLPFAPSFSISRGFYTAPFELTLSSPDNISIYYTTDGTRPNKSTATLYTAPLNISKTTPISAVAINTDNESSEIITNTYWFISDILEQDNTPEGYPADWKKESSSTPIPADYEMDEDICNAEEYKNLMEEALTSIPSISIVTSKHYLFSDVEDENEGGIYIYTGKPSATGEDWVRPTSAEYYDPKTEDQFQLNCQLRLHGGNSRNPSNSPKHGFQLRFKSAYGPSKLNFNLFDEKSATNEFNALVLRAGYNFSWTKNNETQRTDAQYLQDPFAKTTQLAMGQPSAHERFVHLYINGLYWGVYNLSEKITNDFMESYLNGEEDDFDVVKDHGDVVDGNRTMWNKMMSQAGTGLSNNSNYQKLQGKNPDGTINPGYDNLLDVENFIDYMIYNIYIGNGDWDNNNWIAARNRVTNDAGFRFFAWDAETSMTDLNFDNSELNNSDNPSWILQKLKANNDFKVLFADRVQKNLFNDGPLSPGQAANNYVELANEIDKAIIAESARWGDYRRDVDHSSETLYTRNDHWLPRKEYLLNNYFPFRTDIVVEQFRNIGLFPNIEAPLFSEESGEKSSAINLEMTTNYGSIFYTTDGSDPREQITSNIASSAQIFSSAIYLADDVTVKARAKSGNEWSPITEGTFTFDGLTAVEAIATNMLTHKNYPNPFRTSTTIEYNLPADGNVSVEIFTMDGRIIEHIYSGFQFQGLNQVTWNSSSFNSGIYMYRIRFNDETYLGKLIRSK
ncbi:chitobiase/beta-hexosaminidase C-terminal domain-containing protein [uncultured Draconibacterium sp.]|uniref:chitobiase/beta-hexosaminidase C-terminal domain-containing protein n=1 Tax=uncultured Draconibacterium sp. TaxID=1573823 RepID=UPI0032603F54